MGIGKEEIKEVQEKKYLVDIISSDGFNRKNNKDRTDNAIGNVNKTVSSLKEKPYGKHSYLAASLMRDAILLGGMLSNSEAWINVPKEDLTSHQKPDTFLQKELSSASGYPGTKDLHFYITYCHKTQTK